jgi:hypothetical protein
MSRNQKTPMKLRLSLVGAVLSLSLLLAIPSLASAAAPKWQLDLSSFPSSFASGSSGDAKEGPGYRLIATNSGDGPTAGSYALEDTLPLDLTPGAEVSGTVEVEDPGTKKVELKPLSCEVKGQEVTCAGTVAVEPNRKVEMIVPVDVATGISGKALFDEASVEGGGAPAAKATLKTAVGLPAWKIYTLPIPTNLKTGVAGQIAIDVINIGGAVARPPVTVTTTVAQGLVITETEIDGGHPCSVTSQTVTCTHTEQVASGTLFQIVIGVEADPLASGILQTETVVEGGGATPTSVQTPIEITPAIPDFGFLAGPDGFGLPLTSADGSAATQAGSHPHQLTVEMSFPSDKPTDVHVAAAGHLRDAGADLPPGMIVNPNSTPTLCTEVRLIRNKCPESSQIGMVTITTSGLGFLVLALPSTLYNMEPAPGTPATFGFNVGGIGVFAHITGALRSDGDYGLSGRSTEILARGSNPVLGVRLEFWGDPSSGSHDSVRGECYGEKSCPIEEEGKAALLTAPVQCTGQPTIARGRSTDWEEPSNVKSASYESADLAGTPVAIGGCNQLQFQPTIEAKPTTNLADSPSGLDVTVHQPTNEDPGGTSPAIMRDIRLVLPEGMSVNPSSADGLGACPESLANVHSLSPSACPDDSKLGTVEVRTPLLDHPVAGALYLAQPFQNPSGSLVALYLALSDPATGVVSNLAGRVELDPNTGQLTTVFGDNPQLPIEGIKAHLFTGPRAALRTPAACGTYSPRADMTPWSSPQTADAHPSDSFAIQASPNGGGCPTSADQLPNSPSFTAGTLAPQAGAYSPFVLRLTRPDDSQEPQKIETTLAPGLVAKLAGVPYCSEGAISQAQGRNRPNEGTLERDNPSCPSASQIGTVDVAAGAGITPLHTQGKAYLAGPYRGAPLSVVVITPAIAGPFDLGTVVVRTALNVDPETAKVTAVSDPFPRILEGIPLDIRSISIELAKPQFTLNPTSCDPMQVTGALTSVQGNSASLASPFQVGGCDALGFKPKLALKLRGATKRTGHPALTATLTYPSAGAYANVKRAQVTLPRSEFLDQAHIGTVCTRVQFAADQCPAASIYGQATASTPLLDQPLSGPVYLRSSSHELPDLVIALQGQVDVVLAGRVDSVNGGIRTTFDAAPDAPVSKFTLQMQGGKKGLLINSANLCKLAPKQNKATVEMEGQNGKVNDTSPVLANSCKKAKKHKAKKHSK